MLFEPLSLGSLRLDNRLVLAPMTTYSGLEDGTVSAGELAMIRRRAPGFGLVMTAACFVHPSGKAFPGQWGCESEDRLPSLRAMAEVIREAGSKSCLQIHHGGRQCPESLLGHAPWSASAVAAERPNAPIPHAMTEGEIEEILDAYAAAARRAADASFDSVELHGANTYLVQQFVSPHSNRREDRWGRDRLLFSEELVRRTLSAVPADFPVGYRFSPEETETPGIRWPDTQRLIKRIAGMGLAWLHISLRDYRAGSMVGDFGDPILARTHAQVAGRLPLIGVGSVRTREDAEAMLTMGADLAAVGRCAITDPDFAGKVAAGETPETRFPAEGAAEKLVLPEGLVNRILGAPGWFEMR